MKQLISLVFFIFLTTLSFGQKLTKSQKDSIKLVMIKIGEDDQKYRWQMMLGELDPQKLDSLKKLPLDLRIERINRAMQGQVGFNNATRDSISKLQKRLDSENELKFIEIVMKYGYPSFKRVGSTTASYLILHLTGEIEFEKYLAIFRQQLVIGNMPPTDYASWYDRCQVIMQKKQLYGEYNRQFPCVENIDSTNIERKKIGLKKIKTNKCR